MLVLIFWHHHHHLNNIAQKQASIFTGKLSDYKQKTIFFGCDDGKYLIKLGLTSVAQYENVSMVLHAVSYNRQICQDWVSIGFAIFELQFDNTSNSYSDQYS